MSDNKMGGVLADTRGALYAMLEKQEKSIYTDRQLSQAIRRLTELGTHEVLDRLAATSNS